MFIKFKRGNKVPYFQDFRFMRGVKSGIWFKVTKFSGNNGMWLQAPGFGGKPYGNGQICVYLDDVLDTK